MPPKFLACNIRLCQYRGIPDSAEKRWDSRPMAFLWVLAGVFVLACAVRAAYWLSVSESAYFQELALNPAFYRDIAHRILDGSLSPPPYGYGPGFPYLLAGTYAVFGDTVSAIVWFQIVVGSATCAMVAAIARSLFDLRTGLIAGVIACIYGPLIYFSAELLPTTVFLSLVVAAVSCAIIPRRRSSELASGKVDVRWALSGVFWGLCLVFRSVVLLALPLICLDAWRRGGRAGLIRVAAAPAVVLVLGVTLNAAYSNQFVLMTSEGGLNLYVGNNTEADGINPFSTPKSAAVIAELRAEKQNMVEWDRALAQKALAFIGQHPGQALALFAKKFLLTFHDRELPNNADVEWKSSRSWLFRLPLVPLSLGLILPLALPGILLLNRRQRRRASLLFILLALGLATTVIFFTNARFRMVMAPAWVVLAAWTVRRVPQLTAQRALPSVVRVSAAFAFGCILSWPNFYGVKHYRISTVEIMVGEFHLKAGDVSAAVPRLRRVVDEFPTNALGWMSLAEALEQGFFYRDALRIHLDAVARFPGREELEEAAKQFCFDRRIDAQLVDDYVEAGPEQRRALYDTVAARLPR